MKQNTDHSPCASVSHLRGVLRLNVACHQRQVFTNELMIVPPALDQKHDEKKVDLHSKRQKKVDYSTFR